MLNRAFEGSRSAFQRVCVMGCLGMLSASPLCSFERRATPGKSLSNVILILTDDQGYGDFSCHGRAWFKDLNGEDLCGAYFVKLKRLL
jgi:hypothetical protein